MRRIAPVGLLVIGVAGCGLFGARIAAVLRGDPSPPTTGPGSPEFPHAAVTKNEFGIGAQAYLLYEPADPTPPSAPVVVFLHAFGVINPHAYGAWIGHIVRRGNSVIFPIYQDSLMDPATYTANALAAVRDGLDMLASPGHVSPDSSKFALVAHSLGGMIAMNLAALAESAGLPQPRAVLLTHPADANVSIESAPSIREGGYAAIPSTVLFLAVVGSNDRLAGEVGAIVLFDAIPQVPLENREVVKVFSDNRGTTPLVANHSAPLAADEAFDTGQSLSEGNRLLGKRNGESGVAPDALDYFGYWKFTDALLDAAFVGVHRQYALGDTPRQTFMGVFPDGTPVHPAEVIRP